MLLIVFAFWSRLSSRRVDVLSRCSRGLGHALLIDVVKTSLYVYECSNAFLKVFCESWCPSTSTLIIQEGELSISLWDSLKLGSFPVTGRLFDEVVPTAECLSPDLDSDNQIPWSCKFLLLAYHHLASHSPNGTVSMSLWINLWNRSLHTYVGHEAADHSTTKIPPESVTWRATLLDREGPFHFDDKVSYSVRDHAFFISVCTGRVCHTMGSVFIVEPYNPYRFSRQLGYTPVVPGLSTRTWEI
ncbi:hypothetical protein LIER_07868 [Lithospermum erythrorhizon]|uniref:Uncharacterized protein n=1 Tax=Lithospermum erythrorhizon TaxID=34254 RepID=A0AAV3P9W6_LITER